MNLYVQAETLLKEAKIPLKEKKDYKIAILRGKQKACEKAREYEELLKVIDEFEQQIDCGYLTAFPYKILLHKSRTLCFYELKKYDEMLDSATKWNEHFKLYVA